jgi:hypothetical protein
LYDALIKQVIRDILASYPLRQTFDDRGLTDPRLAYEYGVVLRSSAQYGDESFLLLITSYNRIERAFLGPCRQNRSERL